MDTSEPSYAPVPPVRLVMGGIALVRMLVAEFGFVFWLRGLSIRDYLITRDPVSGTIYYVMLVVFAAMLLLVVGDEIADPISEFRTQTIFCRSLDGHL